MAYHDLREIVIVEQLEDFLGIPSIETKEPCTQIGKALPLDLPQILALLEHCHLPLRGVGDVRETTVVARKEGKVVGCAALEVYGTVALLRSVAVSPTHR